MLPEAPPSRAPYFIFAGVVAAFAIAWFVLTRRSDDVPSTPQALVSPPSPKVNPAPAPAPQGTQVSPVVPPPVAQTPPPGPNTRTNGRVTVTEVAPPSAGNTREKKIVADVTAELARRGTPLSAARAADLGSILMIYRTPDAPATATAAEKAAVVEQRKSSIDTIVALASAVLDEAGQKVLAEQLTRSASAP